MSAAEMIIRNNYHNLQTIIPPYHYATKGKSAFLFELLRMHVHVYISTWEQFINFSVDSNLKIRNVLNCYMYLTFYSFSAIVDVRGN